MANADALTFLIQMLVNKGATPSPCRQNIFSPFFKLQVEVNMPEEIKKNPPNNITLSLWWKGNFWGAELPLDNDKHSKEFLIRVIDTWWIWWREQIPDMLNKDFKNELPLNELPLNENV